MFRCLRPFLPGLFAAVSLVLLSFLGSLLAVQLAARPCGCDSGAEAPRMPERRGQQESHGEARTQTFSQGVQPAVPMPLPAPGRLSGVRIQPRPPAGGGNLFPGPGPVPRAAASSGGPDRQPPDPSLTALLKEGPLTSPGLAPRPIVFLPREAPGTGLRLLLSDGEPGLPEPAAFAPVSASALPALLTKLGRAPRTDRARVDELLRQVPGVAIFPPEKVSGRQCLLVFTQPDCVHCVRAWRVLAGQRERLRFPVIFLPIGREAASLAFYTRPGQTLSPEERRQAEAWADAACEWLRGASGEQNPLVPNYCWVTDGEARLSTLSSQELTVLTAWLNARALEQEKAERTGARD